MLIKIGRLRIAMTFLPRGTRGDDTLERRRALAKFGVVQ
jgi:hypothetical protein